MLRVKHKKMNVNLIDDEMNAKLVDLLEEIPEKVLIM